MHFNLVYLPVNSFCAYKVAVKGTKLFQHSALLCNNITD